MTVLGKYCLSVTGKTVLEQAQVYKAAKVSNLSVHLLYWAGLHVGGCISHLFVFVIKCTENAFLTDGLCIIFRIHIVQHLDSEIFEGAKILVTTQYTI